MEFKEFLSLLGLWLFVALFVAGAYLMGYIPQDLLYPMFGLLIVALIGIFALAIKEIFE